MKTIGAKEARTSFSKVLNRVANGESFIIAKRGIPIAILRPVNPKSRKSVKEAIAELKEFQKKHSLGGLSIRELIEEGRR